MSQKTKLKARQKQKTKCFMPVVGQVYRTQIGCEYRCLECLGAVRQGVYNAKFLDEKDGWAFIAHEIKQHKDGVIEWSYATDGYWST